MANFDELNDHNHELTELSNVLMYLFQDREMLDTDTAYDLLYRFMGKFNEHIGQVDNLYHVLLSDRDERSNNTARMFMSGGQELKRIITQYTKAWCSNLHNGLQVADYKRFRNDSEEMFRMVLSRIQDETEHLYPLIRKLRGEARTAA